MNKFDKSSFLNCIIQQTSKQMAQHIFKLWKAMRNKIRALGLGWKMWHLPTNIESPSTRRVSHMTSEVSAEIWIAWVGCNAFLPFQPSWCGGLDSVLPERIFLTKCISAGFSHLTAAKPLSTKHKRTDLCSWNVATVWPFLFHFRHFHHSSRSQKTILTVTKPLSTKDKRPKLCSWKVGTVCFAAALFFISITFSSFDIQFCFLIQQSSCQNKHYFST